tara:strand:- start:68 stop:481 length:414 start_codon:yes stop_codon:yes gene_type:complete
MSTYTDEIKLLVIGTGPANAGAQSVLDHIRSLDGIDEDSAIQQRVDKFLADQGLTEVPANFKQLLTDNQYVHVDSPQPWELERYDSEDAYNADEYKRSRQTEYPSYGEQLDYIYHNGVDAWKADIIDPIKTKYPKSS